MTQKYCDEPYYSKRSVPSQHLRRTYNDSTSIYVSTGCDYNPFFVGIDKGSLLNVFFTFPDFLKASWNNILPHAQGKLQREQISSQPLPLK